MKKICIILSVLFVIFIKFLFNEDSTQFIGKLLVLSTFILLPLIIIIIPFWGVIYIIKKLINKNQEKNTQNIAREKKVYNTKYFAYWSSDPVNSILSSILGFICAICFCVLIYGVTYEILSKYNLIEIDTASTIVISSIFLLFPYFHFYFHYRNRCPNCHAHYFDTEHLSSDAVGSRTEIVPVERKKRYYDNHGAYIGESRETVNEKQSVAVYNHTWVCRRCGCQWIGRKPNEYECK
jgi:rubrerythrin